MHDLATTHEARGRPAGLRRVLLLGSLIGACLVVPGCDLEVSNPSVLEDAFVDDPIMIEALARGVRGSFSFMTAGATDGTLGHGVYIAGALLADELVHTGTHPELRGFSDGLAQDRWALVEALWAESSRARWMANDLIARLDRMIGEIDAQLAAGDTSNIALRRTLSSYRAETHMWAGFIDRVMADHFCNAVTENGLESHEEYYRSAERHFTRVLELAASDTSLMDLVAVSHAGRAQARMQLGDWSGAVADATFDPILLPLEFVFQQEHHYPHPRETNGFRSLSLTSNPELSVWGTPFAEWGRPHQQTVGDPRVVFDVTASAVSGGEEMTGSDGRRPFWQLRKYTGSAAAISIATGVEMLLIEAEALLVSGDWAGAVSKIQELRDYRNGPPGNMDLPPVNATNAEEAWELLMRERGIELWLQGRRIGDLRRWAKTPGYVPTSVVREAGPGDPSSDAVRNVLDVPGDLCIPVGRRERLTNPRI